jgi:hypothetical protein
VAGNLKSLASDHKTCALAMGKWFDGTGAVEMTAFGLPPMSSARASTFFRHIEILCSNFP